MLSLKEQVLQSCLLDHGFLGDTVFFLKILPLDCWRKVVEFLLGEESVRVDIDAEHLVA